MAQAGPVDEKTLRGLKNRGYEHPILDLRLDYIERSQLYSHYILPMAGMAGKGKKKGPPILRQDGRVYPSMLPTQSSGRWSITEPPLPTFPPECVNPECPEDAHLPSLQCYSVRDMVVPDEGCVWATWDYDAIEARIVACESGDEEDVQAYLDGLDIHTITACNIFRWEKPPVLTNALHTAKECQAWREKYTWQGKEDRRRTAAKVARYSLFYGLDERPILLSKDIDRLGVSRDEALEIGRRFLSSKPALTAWKRRTWAQCWKEHKATTFLGRTRKLMGDYHEVIKEGLNHKIQGAVSDVMNTAIIAIVRRWPDAWLAYQSHDGAKVSFQARTTWWPEIRALVERVWTINGYKMPLTADWKVVDDQGRTWKKPEDWRAQNV